MPNLEWKLENIQDKPNSREGRTAKLCAYDAHGMQKGWCYVEGWLYGCGLMGLHHLSTLAPIDVSEFPNFRNFLKHLSVTLDQTSMYNCYTAGRYMFTVAGQSSGFVHQLVVESELVKSFENLAHTSPTNQMYFLNVKKNVKDVE